MGIAVVALALAAVLIIGLIALLWRPQDEAAVLDTAGPGGVERETESAAEAEDASTFSMPTGDGIADNGTPASPLVDLEGGLTMENDRADANGPVGGHPEQAPEQAQELAAQECAEGAETPDISRAPEPEGVTPEALVSAALVPEAATVPGDGPPTAPTAPTALMRADVAAPAASPESEGFISNPAIGGGAVLPDGYHLGNAAFTQGNYPQALEYYTQAIAAQPELAEAYNNRGNVNYALGRWQEAQDDYSQAIALRPSYATAHFNGGMVHYRLGNVEQAIASFSQALEHHPGYAEAYNNRGNCYVIVQAYQEAIEDFDQALELNPEFTAAYNNVGNLYYQIKNFDEALASYDQSLAIQPDQPEAHNNKGNAYLALGNYAEAVENFNRAIALKADYAEAYYNRGLVHRKLGQNQESQADLSQAQQLAQQQQNAALIQTMQGTPI